jgi:hypothetical protein
MIALLAIPLALLGTQQGIADRLAGRVPPEVAALVEELGSSAAARGLPIDPLIQKAIEGSAKRVPADRVAAAVRLVAAQLDTAATALGEGETAFATDTIAITAGGFAIAAGLSGRDIAVLARSGAPLAELIVGLRVAGTLVALGVPPAETVALVTATLQTGEPTADLLALPAKVRAEMSKGVPAAAAAAGLSRAAAAQGRHGPPPERGNPNRPPPPPRP